MALGAQVSDVIRLILGSGIRLALVGAAIGIIGALGLARLIANIMPAMQTNGVLVLMATTFLLVVLALAACWLPARRAAKVDPMEALRCE
jgi:ABC-type antimicrobial peptide transport system permease subunit